MNLYALTLWIIVAFDDERKRACTVPNEIQWWGLIDQLFYEFLGPLGYDFIIYMVLF